MTKQKYNIGDTVWLIEAQGIVSKVVTAICYYSKEGVLYGFSKLTDSTSERGLIPSYAQYQEKHLFDSKESLIESLASN